MAYGKRAYSIFYDQVNNTRIDVEIHQEGFNPAGALPMLLSNDAIFTRLLPDGDKYTIIKGREATINIVVKPSDDFSWLYTNDDRELMVIIKEATVIEWTGFVVVDQYIEEQRPVRILQVIASDQLGLLDTRPYTFGSPAVSPTGYQKAIVVLANILSGTNKTKTGLDIMIYCAMNLFEVTMAITNDSDPLDQAYVNQDLWINDDLSTASCKQVIEDILRPYQCRILQSVGVWWIQRIPDMADASIDYRIFNRDGVQTGYSTLSPKISGSLKLATGTLQFNSGWMQRTLEVDYGFRDAPAPSFGLPDLVFTQDNPAIITGWTNTGEWNRIQKGDKNILMATTGNRTSWDSARYIDMPTIAVTTLEHTFAMASGRRDKTFLFIYCHMTIYVWDGVNISSIKYYNDKNNTWQNTHRFIKNINFKKTNVPEELTLQSIVFTPPVNGYLVTRVYDPWFSSGATINSNFYFTDVKLTATIVSEAGEDKFKEISFLDFISDNTNFIPGNERIRISDGLGVNALIPYYKGIIKVGSVASTTWEKKSLFGTGTDLPLAPRGLPTGITISKNCIMDSWWWQFSTQNKRYDGSFRGVIHFHNTVVIDSVTYLLNDNEIDLKRSQFSGSFLEIKSETPNSGLGTQTLKSRSSTDGTVSSGSGLIPSPGGDDGQLQFKTGGDFDGTTGITFDGTRILKGGTIPLIEYHSGTESVSAGTTQITFAAPFLAGDVWNFSAPIIGYSVDYGYLFGMVTDRTITGFKVTFDYPVTFEYSAFITR